MVFQDQLLEIFPENAKKTLVMFRKILRERTSVIGVDLKDRKILEKAYNDEEDNSKV